MSTSITRQLTSLKASELKQLAFLTGLSSSSARKADLALCVANGLYTPRLSFPSLQSQSAQARILSIDMGIRNLAYCVVDVSPPALSLSSSSSSSSSSLPGSPSSSLTELCSALVAPDHDDREQLGRSSVLERVKLHAWKRISLFAAHQNPTGGASKTDTETDSETERREIGSDNEVERFDPASIAKHAYAFLAPLVYAHRPTQILIERQRHRSNGMSAVLEWTMRVNMLESMFFAILETMQRSSEASRASPSPATSTSVASVDPKRVATFWTGMFPREPLAAGSAATTRRKTPLEKEARIAIVESLLTSSKRSPQCSAEASRTRAAFLGARQRKIAPRRRSSPSKGIRREETNESNDKNQVVVGERLNKLDDLADSLLQALAWAQWDTNRLALLQHFSKHSEHFSKHA